MSRKVFKAGIKRQKGYLYFVDKDGDISAAKMKQFKNDDLISQTMDGTKKRRKSKKK